MSKLDLDVCIMHSVYSSTTSFNVNVNTYIIINNYNLLINIKDARSVSFRSELFTSYI